MSRYLSSKYQALEPYVPGEQPKMLQLIKLNTNESPWSPAPGIAEAIRKETEKLNLYSDPECTELRRTLANSLGLKPEELLITNGSDEILNFAFMAYCDAGHPAVFPDITYGFYPVFARINQIPYTEIPLRQLFLTMAECPSSKNRSRISVSATSNVMESVPDSCANMPASSVRKSLKLSMRRSSFRP